MRTAALCALLLVAVSSGGVEAQERRDSTRRGVATSAEEMHRIRRAWLEQRRLGQLEDAPPVFGSAVVGRPRVGRATGIAVGGRLAGGFGGGFGVPFAGSLHCEAFVQPGGFGGFDGYGTGRRGWSRGGFAFGGGCLPAGPPVVPFGVPGAYGFPGAGLPYPAYPPYGRFYDRFHPEESRRGGGWTDPLLFGVREYDWGWSGPWRSYPGALGWADGAYGWYSASPWSLSPSDCIDLTLALANGRVHRMLVGLQSLGLADARDLDLAIDARLSQGEPVMLQGLDGRVLRIDPGSAIDDIIVRPCGG